MTQLLERAFSEASKLPDNEQDAVASFLLAELQSERQWAQAFTSSQAQLGALADEALREFEAGETLNASGSFSESYRLFNYMKSAKVRFGASRRATPNRFALCIENEDYEASLIPGKVYRVFPDAKAGRDDLVRIVDESGEDYLYHKSLFVFVEFPKSVEKKILASTA